MCFRSFETPLSSPLSKVLHKKGLGRKILIERNQARECPDSVEMESPELYEIENPDFYEMESPISIKGNFV